MQGNPVVLATIVETALEEIPRLVSSLQRAAAERNATAFRLAAHTLKGSLRYFGAAMAVQQAHRLEEMGGESDLQAAAQALRLLDAQTQEIVRCLSEYLQSTHEFS